MDEFEEEGNPLVGLAKKMTSRMFQMVEYTKGKGQKIQVHTVIEIVIQCFNDTSLKVVRCMHK